MSNTLQLITLGLYALASVAYIAHLVARGDKSREAARIALAVALLGHFASIGVQCSGGFHPLTGTSGLLSLIAFILCVAFLAGTFRWKLGSLGAAMALLAFGLLLAARLAQGKEPPVAQAVLFLKRMHLTLVALGVSAFALAAGVAVLYLVQNAALKGGRVGGERRGPAITTLDTLGRRLVMVGFPVFTLAVITGVLWMLKAGGSGGFRLEYGFAGIVWLIFAVLIGGRLTVGLRGRSAALLTLAGFGFTAVVLLIYVGRRVIA
ncbi:MAG: cytochrome c biogenesis protein CcsA [Myxococcales bacterium]|nr:cytochrome c biogenesis protein CcsA [Myxococcales bacterium]